MAQLRRGFKVWCENAAHGYRRDLGLRRYDALDPRLLAKHLEVIVKEPEDIPGLDKKALKQLLKTDPTSWSAVTLKLGNKFLIISNSSHSLERQNSNLAHELAHIILEHEPKKVLLSPDGQMMLTDYNSGDEDEANCLAGALLVPREGLFVQLKSRKSDIEMAAFFGVSQDLLRMRKNITGVMRQLQARAS